MSPLIDVANATKSVPLLFAFLLGIVGTLAPCQLTGNISAITLYSNQSLQKRMLETSNHNYMRKIKGLTFRKIERT